MWACWKINRGTNQENYRSCTRLIREPAKKKIKLTWAAFEHHQPTSKIACIENAGEKVCVSWKLHHQRKIGIWNLCEYGHNNLFIFYWVISCDWHKLRVNCKIKYSFSLFKLKKEVLLCTKLHCLGQFRYDLYFKWETAFSCI